MIKTKDYLKEKQRAINRFLYRYLPKGNTFPAPIYRAMRYSVLNGGKRLRGILVLASGAVFEVAERVLMPVAAALELVHTYSLVHDDLPAMDNDNFRRGKPTCHRVFGEAIAILTGDALLTLAFQLVATRIRDTKLCVRLVKEISAAAGAGGMVGGQVIDIQNAGGLKNRRAKELRLKKMHLLKTAALITTAVRTGALMGHPSTRQLAYLTQYGKNLGLAFQITDDILDVQGKKDLLGKTPGKDQNLGKLTYPGLYGVSQARIEAHRLVTKAKESLRPFGHRGQVLAALADYVLNRKY